MLYDSVEIFTTPARHIDFGLALKLAAPKFGALIFNKNIDLSKIQRDLLWLPQRFGYMFWFAVLQHKLTNYNDNLDAKPPLETTRQEGNFFIANISYNSKVNCFEVVCSIGGDLVFTPSGYIKPNENADNTDEDWEQVTSNPVRESVNVDTVECIKTLKPIPITVADFNDCITTGCLSNFLNYFNRIDVFAESRNYADLFVPGTSAKNHIGIEYFTKFGYHSDAKDSKQLLVEGLVNRLKANTEISTWAVARLLGQLKLVFVIQRSFDAANITSLAADKLDFLSKQVKLAVDDKNKFGIDYLSPVLPLYSYDPFSLQLYQIADEFEKSNSILDAKLLNDAYLSEFRITLPRIIASLDCSIADKFKIWQLYYDPQWLLVKKQNSNNSGYLGQNNIKKILDAYNPALMIAHELLFSIAPFADVPVARRPEETKTAVVKILPELNLWRQQLTKELSSFEAAIAEFTKDPTAFSRIKNISFLQQELDKDSKQCNVEISTKFLEYQLPLETERNADWLYCVKPQNWLNFIDQQLRRTATALGLVNFFAEGGQLILLRLYVPTEVRGNFSLEFCLKFPTQKQWDLKLIATETEIKACNSIAFKQSWSLPLEEIGSMGLEALEMRLQQEKAFYSLANSQAILQPTEVITAAQILVNLTPEINRYFDRTASTLKIKSSPRSQNISASIKEDKYRGKIHDTYGPAVLFAIELIFLNLEVETIHIARVITALREFEYVPNEFLNILLANLRCVIFKPQTLDIIDPPLVGFYNWLDKQVKAQSLKKTTSQYFANFAKAGSNSATNIEVWQRMLLHLNKSTLSHTERSLVLATLKKGSFNTIFSVGETVAGRVAAAIDAAQKLVDAAQQNYVQLENFPPLHSITRKIKLDWHKLQAEITANKTEVLATVTNIESLVQTEADLNQRLEHYLHEAQNLSKNIANNYASYCALSNSLATLSAVHDKQIILPELRVSETEQSLVVDYSSDAPNKSHGSYVLFNCGQFYSTVQQYCVLRNELKIAHMSVDENASLVVQAKAWKRKLLAELQQQRQLQTLNAQLRSILTEVQPKIQRLHTFNNNFTTTVNHLEQYREHLQKFTDKTNAALKLQRDNLERINTETDTYLRCAVDVRDDLINARKQFHQSFFKHAANVLGKKQGENFCRVISEKTPGDYTKVHSKDVNLWHWRNIDWLFLDWLFGKRAAKAQLLKIYNTYEEKYHKHAENLFECDYVEGPENLDIYQEAVCGVYIALELAMQQLQKKAGKSLNKNNWLRDFISTIATQKTSVITRVNNLKQEINQQKTKIARTIEQLNSALSTEVASAGEAINNICLQQILQARELDVELRAEAVEFKNAQLDLIANQQQMDIYKFKRK